MSADDRIERLLAAGHPEADAYSPPGFDRSRTPAQEAWKPRARSAALTAAAAAVIVIAILGSVRPNENSTIASPPGTAMASADASPSAATSPTHPAFEVVTVEAPEQAVTARLAEHGTGCFAMGTADFLMDRGEEWDARIEASGIVHGWLEERHWVGADRTEVAQAFGGTWAAYTPKSRQGLEEMWILTESNGRPMALQLIPWHTPRGHTVWHAWNTVAVTSCDFPTPPPITIRVVEHPREAAMEELVRLGARCFQGSDILTVAPDPELLDRQIRDAGIETGWLQTGSRWVGEDPTLMVLALGSGFAVAGPDERHLWTVVRRNGTLTSREYRTVITPNGHWVWIRGDMDQAIPC